VEAGGVEVIKEERLVRLLKELAQHESVICLPCAMGQGIVRDAATYLLNGQHKTPVCAECCRRELSHGNAPDGLIPVEQPYVTKRIREELPLIEAGL
jgi:hypothetical protein